MANSGQNLNISLRYSDLYIQKQQERSGDEPLLQTFEGRVRLDPKATPSVVTTMAIKGNPTYTFPNVTSQRNARVQDGERLTGSGQSLSLFDPPVYWRSGSNPTNLKLDVLVAGAIAWEEDSGNQGSRAAVTNSLLARMQSVLTASASKLNIPFDYWAYYNGGTTRTAGGSKPGGTGMWRRWFPALATAMNSFVSDLKTGLDTTVLESIRQGINSEMSGDRDEVTGVHINVLIPIDAVFYKNIISARNLQKSSSDPLLPIFPKSAELLNTIDFNKAEANRGDASQRHSFVVTYGFVPQSNPLLPMDTRPYEKNMGALGSLEFRGGFNGPYNEQEWTCSLPQINVNLAA